MQRAIPHCYDSLFCIFQLIGNHSTRPYCFLSFHLVYDNGTVKHISSHLNNRQECSNDTHKIVTHFYVNCFLHLQLMKIDPYFIIAQFYPKNAMSYP